LNTFGPFWEDFRQHGTNDWIEVNGEPVTDSAVGEAAFCCIHGLPRELVSFDPSDWLFSPVKATWLRDDSQAEPVSIPNHWRLESAQESLAANPPTIDSWAELSTFSRGAYTRLTIAEDALKTQQIRIHFSWPIRVDTPLYVVYVGPKITKR
jgi:hypothetical protein